MMVDYIQHWGDDLSPVNAARVSFNKQSDWVVEELDGTATAMSLSAKDEKLIKYLADNQHTSCFEHMGATLKLKVPIFIARQIQRHRTFSYNEISRRYVDSPPEFYWPETWRKRAENVKQGSSDEVVTELSPMASYSDPLATRPIPMENVQRMVLNTCVGMYNKMLEDGVAPELARMILPQNMYTEFYMSGNLRAWSHLLHLRLDEHAQKEVRQVAQQVKDILYPLFPASIEALLTGETN